MKTEDYQVLLAIVFFVSVFTTLWDKAKDQWKK
jgi:hypothetical protein